MFNLTQSISEPTHNQGHLLDLVFSKQSDNIFISTKLHHGLTSDHTAILCKLDVSVPVQKPETFSYRCLKKIDTSAFKQDLSHEVSQVSSISDYNNHLCSVLDKHAPLCRCTVRTRKPTPWFSNIAEHFYELKRERRQADRRWLKSKLTVHKQIYDSIKQKVTNLVDKAKQAYYSAIFSLAQPVNSSFKTSTPSSAKADLHIFLQHLTLMTFRMSFLITALKKSATSETIFLLQTQLLALIPFSLEIPC